MITGMNPEKFRLLLPELPVIGISMIAMIAVKNVAPDPGNTVIFFILTGIFDVMFIAITRMACKFMPFVKKCIENRFRVADGRDISLA